MNLKLIFLLLLFFCCLLACSQENSLGIEKKWTIGLYFAGESNLEDSYVTAFEKIKKNHSNFKDNHLVVFFDRDNLIETDTDPKTTWKGTKVFDINETRIKEVQFRRAERLPQAIFYDHYTNFIKPKLNEEESNLFFKHYVKQDHRFLLKQDMNSVDKRKLTTIFNRLAYLLPLRTEQQTNLKAVDGDTLRQFAFYLKDNYHSKHYLLIICGQANGFFKDKNKVPYERPVFLSNPEYSANFDERIVKDGLRFSPFDILLLNMPLMGSLETSWALRNTCDYLIVSEANLPGDCLDLGSLLNNLAQSYPYDPRKVSDLIIQQFAFNLFFSQRTQDPVAVSAVNFNAAYFNFLNEFYLVSHKPGARARIKAALDKVKTINYHGPDTGKMVDLKQFVIELNDKALLKFIKEGKFDFILASHMNNDNLAGLSIFNPVNKNQLSKDELLYRELDFYERLPRWLGMK
jgi:hypothetical protein